LKDEALPRSDLYFADLHFHSHYSDNRDRASIEQMLLEGRKHGVSIFGLGDHNHNLDIAKWRKTKLESTGLRRKYPHLLVMENCEITFLLGHLLVLRPRRITGSIQEGYEFLYRKRGCLKIPAHPNPDTDEWHERFVPDAAGIEVINGSVFRKARETARSIDTILDIPMVRLYARYLYLGYPVSAIGNSDAHQVADMGSGLTGMWLEVPLSPKNVLAAIRHRKTFATTDPGIQLRWNIDRGTNIFSWQVEWNPMDFRVPKEHTTEVYCGQRKIQTAQESGCTEIQTNGLYWIAAFNSEAYAVSSPLECSRAGTTPMARSSDLPSELLRKPLKDLAFLQLRTSRAVDTSPATHRGFAEIDLLSSGRKPLLVDAAGRSVPYKVLVPAREKIIIDKSCLSPCFDEFFLWLQRNEIHEYGFLELHYRKEQGLFHLQGRIVPAIMVLIKDFQAWHRAEISRIRKLIDSSTRFRLDVRTLFTSTVSLPLKDHPFPLRIRERAEKATSLLVWNELRPEGKALGRYPGWQSMQVPEPTAGDRIFQIFVSPAGE